MELGESIFAKCDCGCCSVVEINADTFDKGSVQFNFALWVAHPGTRPLSKKERIRWCEHVMKTGKPWADHTIVTEENARKLVAFIQKHLLPPKYGKKNRVGNKPSRT